MRDAANNGLDVDMFFIVPTQVPPYAAEAQKKLFLPEKRRTIEVPLLQRAYSTSHLRGERLGNGTMSIAMHDIEGKRPSNKERGVSRGHIFTSV